jgi:ornithine cyclodeaminase
MGKRTEFLFLSEPDMVKAGVLNALGCVNTCEEVFKLLGTGDYLMGGANHNSHGMGVVFPKETPFPNMPVAGPDRRFVAMPGYLGGRFDVCGVKWYGSNQDNKKHGLPRSVLTVILNDKETGEPLAFMSANLLSSARTGGVPAVASRYTVRAGSKTIAVIGCGAINRSCLRHILSQNPGLQEIVCFDIFEAAANSFAMWAAEEFGLDARVEMDLASALGVADVVTVAASRLQPLHAEDSWFKRGATVLLTGPMTADDDFWLNSTIVYDNIHLHETYVEEAHEAPDLHEAYAGVIGGPLYELIDQGKLPALVDSTDLGNVILGNKPGRQNDDERMVFVACGMSIFDLGWGYDLYRNALDEGIGQKLTLWDSPVQA